MNEVIETAAAAVMIVIIGVTAVWLIKSFLEK